MQGIVTYVSNCKWHVHETPKQKCPLCTNNILDALVSVFIQGKNINIEKKENSICKWYDNTFGKPKRVSDNTNMNKRLQ